MKKLYLLALLACPGIGHTSSELSTRFADEVYIATPTSFRVGGYTFKNKVSFDGCKVNLDIWDRYKSKSNEYDTEHSYKASFVVGDILMIEPKSGLSAPFVLKIEFKSEIVRNIVKYHVTKKVSKFNRDTVEVYFQDERNAKVAALNLNRFLDNCK